MEQAPAELLEYLRPEYLREVSLLAVVPMLLPMLREVVRRECCLFEVTLFVRSLIITR